jgi:tetratricopeptide (TPR) repeat protein
MRRHLAHVALQLGEGAQALKLWKAQARRQGRRQGTDHPSYAATLNSIGNALLQLGRQADALLAYNRSAGVFASAKGYGPNCPGCATVYTNIGSLYYSADEFDHARRYYIRARAICEVRTSEICRIV